MISNRKSSRKSKRVNVKVDRVFYKMDKDGNFVEGKESMRSLYDANFKEERKFDKRRNNRNFRK